MRIQREPGPLPGPLCLQEQKEKLRDRKQGKPSVEPSSRHGLPKREAGVKGEGQEKNGAKTKVLIKAQSLFFSSAFIQVKTHP